MRHRIIWPIIAAALVASAVPAGAVSTRTWGLLGIDCQYERLVRAGESGTGPDVLIVGSSMAFRGIYSPQVELTAPGLSVLNSAYPGGDINTMLFFTSRVALRLIDPEIVLIAVASRDINMVGEHQSMTAERFRVSQGVTFTTRGDLDYALGQIAAGTRARAFAAAVRRPDLVTSPLAEGWRPKAAGYESPGWLYSHLRRSRCNQVRDIDRGVFAGATEAEVAAFRARALDPFDPASGFDPLERLVRRVRGAGATPLILAMPVPDQYRSAHPGGTATHDAYLADMENLATTLHVGLIDATGRFAGADHFFRDLNHLNVAGARRLSRDLGPLLLDPPTGRVTLDR